MLKYLLLIVVWTAVISARKLSVHDAEMLFEDAIQLDGVCKDNNNLNHATCGEWKDQGYCDDVKEITNMMRRCKKTCEFCGETCTGTSCPTTCEDKRTKDKNCKTLEMWGYCKVDLYIDYLKKDCKKTCGLCRGPVCKNNLKGPSCEKWKKAGYCANVIVETYMKKNCEKSCGFC